MLSGQIINRIRELKTLTQEEMADRIGLSRQTIAMWETGKRVPTDSVAILTARFLELDEDELLSLLQHERLRSRVERLQDQYGVTIIIADTPNNGGITMSNPKHISYQTQQGVHFAVTHVYKSLRYDYPEKLLKDGEAFHAPFETSHPEERLIIKMIAQSENEEFILNGRYFNDIEIVDNLGNRFWPIAAGLRSSTPPEYAAGSFVEGYAHYRYMPEARSISLSQRVASIRKEDCDFIAYDNVKLDGGGISKQLGDVTITYDGVRTFEYGDSPDKKEARQIQIQLHEHGNPTYVGIHKFVDNLGNEHSIPGWSWTLGEKTQETIR